MVVVFKSGCKVEASGSFDQPDPHPRPIKSESPGIGSRPWEFSSAGGFNV
jgi:hypothetical protein